MKISFLAIQKGLILIFLMIFLAWIVRTPLPIPDRVGSIDFRAYWSASYLFTRGMDFGDPQALDNVERSLTGWDGAFTMQAWFTPTGHLFLSPLTFLPFPQAARVWLLFNIFLLTLSAWLLADSDESPPWLPISVTFCFSATLTSIFFGQINTLSVAGLALYLYFRRQQKDVLAGFSLILILIKPHLVSLTLLPLLLSLIWHKRWRVLLGAGLSGVAVLLALFLIHRGWLLSFWKVAQSGLGSARLAPSLAGLLVYLGYPYAGQWLWCIGLLLVLGGWWLFKDIEERRLFDLTLPFGLALNPYGWSYDQIILLLPLLSLVRWIAASPPGRVKWGFAICLIGLNLLSYLQRLVVQNDVWFFWIPLMVFGMYLAGVPEELQSRKDRINGS
ncbi:MAG: hypothetical protein ANABAC_2998 [Anaerolineae bacterium]|jgi:hypothetical protein|nr:MAG: hypothetical protein ANABAC_2998 [Anaerolineae bacterium]